MAKVQIICGDFPQGNGSLGLWQLRMPVAKGHLLGENINLVELEDTQIASAEIIRGFGEQSSWPESTENVLRQFEAHVAAAKKNEVVFVGVFADGRKFLASAKGSTYKKLLQDWADAGKKGFKREADKTAKDKSRENTRLMVFGTLMVGGLLVLSVLALKPESGCADLACEAGPTRSKKESAKATQSEYERDISDGELGRVCRATIAASMGHDPQIIQVVRVGGGLAYTSYSRPSDGKVWKNRCRVEGDRVIWSTVDLDGPGTGPGRWRTHPLDERITYSIDGAQVSITIYYDDGSITKKSYTMN